MDCVLVVLEYGMEGQEGRLKIMNHTRQTTTSGELLCYKLEKIA